ncbi:MAG: hypothetical protein ACMXX5_02380, partial [Candidatus Woesearchaeota archaeon]
FNRKKKTLTQEIYERDEIETRIEQDTTVDPTEDEVLIIKAYHGTPHTIIDDRFSLTHVGTGEAGMEIADRRAENAGEKGYGIYLAESHAVAEIYRQTLSSWQIDGIPVENYESQVQRTPENQDIIAIANTIAMIQGRGPTLAETSPLDSSIQNLGRVRQELFEQLKDSGRLSNTGHVYTTEMRINPTKMLDWDKPLSEQSEYIREIIQNDPLLSDIMTRVVNGGGLYNTLSSELNLRSTEYITQKDVSNYLKNLGVQGIIYLDSQSKELGGDTHNYVIFDENVITITEKDGVPIAEEIIHQEIIQDESAPEQDAHEEIEKERMILKAAEVLERDITIDEIDAMWEAHLVGSSEGRTIGTYTEQDIAEKARILAETGTITLEERRKLIEAGVVGREINPAIAQFISEHNVPRSANEEKYRIARTALIMRYGFDNYQDKQLRPEVIYELKNRYPNGFTEQSQKAFESRWRSDKVDANMQALAALNSFLNQIETSITATEAEKSTAISEFINAGTNINSKQAQSAVNADASRSEYKRLIDHSARNYRLLLVEYQKLRANQNRDPTDVSLESWQASRKNMFASKRYQDPTGTRSSAEDGLYTKEEAIALAETYATRKSQIRTAMDLFKWVNFHAAKRYINSESKIKQDSIDSIIHEIGKPPISLFTTAISTRSEGYHQVFIENTLSENQEKMLGEILHKIAIFSEKHPFSSNERLYIDPGPITRAGNYIGEGKVVLTYSFKPTYKDLGGRIIHSTNIGIVSTVEEASIITNFLRRNPDKAMDLFKRMLGTPQNNPELVEQLMSVEKDGKIEILTKNYNPKSKHDEDLYKTVSVKKGIAGPQFMIDENDKVVGAFLTDGEGIRKT